MQTYLKSLAVIGFLAGAMVSSVNLAGPAQAGAVLQVNFQTQQTTTPAGYQADYGQAYDATRGYGWVNSAGAPLSLVGNGRERGVNPDKRLDTFMQMQLKAGSAGVSTTGLWKASVPNATYSVTIAAGDPSYIDSHDVLNVEGQKAIDFTPTRSSISQINTITVTVSDGFLNVDASGGANTKIDFISVQPASATAPYVTAVTPADKTTNVTLDASVTVQLSGGVDPTTVNASTIKLLNPDGSQIAGHYNTDGAYSNATFVPSANVAANTVYTVQVTSALTDPNGIAYTPFSSTFTTGTSTSNPQASVKFASTVFDYSDGTSATNATYKTSAPTSLALGPDPAHPTQLWAAFGTGLILVYNLDAGTGQKIGTPTPITTFQSQRTIAGMKFDPASTATNIILWVSNGQYGCDLAAIGTACTDFTGALSTLTGSAVSSLVKTDVVTGLPRSVGNHMNNGFDFGPDGAIYLAQAANTGYGAPDSIWGNRSEDPLTAAILRIDYKRMTTLPYNVDTSQGYDPTAAGALVTVYASGTRNPFSVVWASNGRLYAPVNESASGDTPADPNGGAPALTNLPAYDDYFTQVVAGKFYGHPNPARGEYRLNGANPTAGTDPFQVNEYPVGVTPNPNWQQPDMDLGLHRSADGSSEYKSTAFGGSLAGQILVTEYSQGKDIIAIKLDSTGKAVSRTVVASGFNNPLPIVTDTATGRIYVGEYGRDPDGVGGLLTLLTPNTSVSTAFHVNFQTQTAATPAGYTADYGQGYSVTRGYGWESNAKGTALSIVGNGRERNVNPDKRLDTLISMQATSNVTVPAKWELIVPNGTYDLTIGIGDPSYFDSHDILNVEGVKVVDFQPTTAQRQTTITATVTVADGKLTVDPTGGSNTKIDFIDAVPHASGGSVR